MTTVVYIYQNDEAVNESIKNLPSNVQVIAVKQLEGTPRTELVRDEGRVKYYNRYSLFFRFDEARNDTIRLVKSEWIIMLDEDEFLCATEREIFEMDNINHKVGGLIFDIISPSVNSSNEIQTSVSRYVRAFRNFGFKYEFRAHEQIAPSILDAGYKVIWYPIIIRHYGYLTENYQDFKRLAVKKLMRNLELNILDYSEINDINKKEFLLDAIMNTSKSLIEIRNETK